MTQEQFDEKNIDDESIPGSWVVIGMIVCMVGFPLFCAILLAYSRYVGQKEGVRDGYSTLRDPKTWLFTVLVLVVCGLFAWMLGRGEKAKK